MKVHWLRGVLLGVSLALLLGAGVAVAADEILYLSVTADKDCVECWPYTGDDEEVMPPDKYIVQLTIRGWVPGHPLGLQVNPPGGWTSWLPEGEFGSPQHAGFFLDCEGMVGYIFPGMDEFSAPVSVSDEDEWVYGEHEILVWQPDHEGWELDPPWLHSAKTSVTVAEDCTPEVVEEFVPEPGTLMLLGSGLAGLAGYATLRWRARR